MRRERRELPLELGDETPMERVAQRSSSERVAESGRLFERTRFDDRLDRGDERERARILGQAGFLRLAFEPLDEVPGAALDEEAVAEDLPRRLDDVVIAVADQNPQRIANFLEYSKIEDEVDLRLLVGERIVRQVAGARVDAAEPDLHVQMPALVIAHRSAIELRREPIEDADVLAVDDEDAGPDGNESSRDLDARHHLLRCAMNGSHDALF